MTGPTLSVEVARPQDLAEIDALLARSYPALLKADYPPSVLVTAIPLIARANPRLIASGNYAVVRDAEGRIRGAGGLTREAPPGGGSGAPGVGHIRHVVTDHRYLRKGVGRTLMSWLHARAEAAGVTRFECYSTLTAEPFYAACGYVRVAPMTVALRPGIDFPAVHMRRVNET